MLSYQHIYHAGCLADVHKHAALAVILSKMVEKPKPLSYLETHAGRGMYDLSCKEAEKTGEAKDGILRMQAEKKIPQSHPFASQIKAIRAALGDSFYPGSAYIAKSILRKDDKIHLMEMHPKEHAALKQNMRGSNVRVYQRDGYAGVLSISPPQPRRGIVFIDPSFEIKTEYESMADYISNLHKKWPEAVILLWYPILKSNLHQKMADQIRALNLQKFWHQEVIFDKIGDIGIMQGSGLICVNTPFGAEEDLDAIAGWF